ncbi:hypothetical protein chiPu_0003663 [Chiloscyllium punctatum]|uniref:Uncharacterized protein n=1 Tax=Chiloscyllium punctatum TaxID=137246 RepID=A0A401S4D9_CHIPU|nr:hypothetical protein [Chiloscyllium punctatum]
MTALTARPPPGNYFRLNFPPALSAKLEEVERPDGRGGEPIGVAVAPSNAPKRRVISEDGPIRVEDPAGARKFGGSWRPAGNAHAQRSCPGAGLEIGLKKNPSGDIKKTAREGDRNEGRSCCNPCLEKKRATRKKERERIQLFHLYCHFDLRMCCLSKNEQKKTKMEDLSRPLVVLNL